MDTKVNLDKQLGRNNAEGTTQKKRLSYIIYRLIMIIIGAALTAVAIELFMVPNRIIVDS